MSYDHWKTTEPEELRWAGHEIEMSPELRQEILGADSASEEHTVCKHCGSACNHGEDYCNWCAFHLSYNAGM